MVNAVRCLLRALLISTLAPCLSCTTSTQKPLTYHPHPPQTGSDTAQPDSGSLSDRTDTGSEDTAEDVDTAGQEDTGIVERCAVPIVLTGSEFIGAPASSPGWWDDLLDTLICRGDVTASGDLRAGIFYEAERTGPSATLLVELEEALLERGVDDVQPFLVAGPDDAAAALEDVDSLDVAILFPVTPGDAYDAWNDSALEDALQRLHAERGGGILGMGPGAMLLAGSSLAGGQDYLSTHVMIDGHTTELDDLSTGGSALHDDFLPMVAAATIDTRFTELGRLVRLVGALARRADEAPEERIWGIGLDTYSGLIVRGDEATVIGPGTVSLIRPTSDSVLSREHWEPLTWTHLEYDRLTAGWVIDLESGSVDISRPPASAEPVEWSAEPYGLTDADWQVNGHLPEEEVHFGTMVERSEFTFSTTVGTADVTLPGVLGMLDADFFETQALNHEALYSALYEHIGHTGVLVTYQGRLEQRASEPGVLRFSWNTPLQSRDDPDMLLERWEPCHVVVDTHAVSWRSLSEITSAHSSAIYPSGMLGMTLHLLAGSDGDGWTYDIAAHAPVSP